MATAERTPESRVRLVCGNCGKIRFFTSFEEAFEDGWDSVDRFGYNGCEACPGVSVYFPMMHAQAAREATAAGRPDVARSELEKAAAYTLEPWPTFGGGNNGER